MIKWQPISVVLAFSFYTCQYFSLSACETNAIADDHTSVINHLDTLTDLQNHCRCCSGSSKFRLTASRSFLLASSMTWSTTTASTFEFPPANHDWTVGTCISQPAFSHDRLRLVCRNQSRCTYCKFAVHNEFLCQSVNKNTFYNAMYYEWIRVTE